MFVGDLRAQAIDVVVAAVDAHHLRAKHLRAQNFRGLQIRRNKNPRLQTFASRLRRDRVREVSSGRASDGIESEAAGIGQRDRNHAVFEAQCGQAHRIIFDKDAPRSDPLAEPRSAHQRRVAHWQRRLKSRRQRQQFAIAPHVRGARGEQLARKARAQRIVIVGNFERRETVFTDAARLVAPGLAAFAAAEVVGARLHFATSFCDCGTSRVKNYPSYDKTPFPNGKRGSGNANQISLTRISWSPLPGESWHLSIGIYDPVPVAVAS